MSPSPNRICIRDSIQLNPRRRVNEGGKHWVEEDPTIEGEGKEKRNIVSGLYMTSSSSLILQKKGNLLQVP